MEIGLDGRTAVITGGSKGLGLAIATKFAAAGADVAILARRRDALEEAKRTIRRSRGPRGRGNCGKPRRRRLRCFRFQ